jgi:tRNA nucleotidyltransferase (CCA-adding enzyme)
VAEPFDLTSIPPEVAAIAKTLRDAGHEAWYVGGAVRDSLLLRTTHHAPRTASDFDIATSARPEQVRKLFRRSIPVGIEHGTVAVLDAANRGHEVTTFRRDVKTDGRHAQVEFGVSLDDDLARRDFTINAIAVHSGTGELRDPFDGRKDIAAATVRAVGDPLTRFREDWLRVLRGLRFAASFDFAIEPATWDAIVASAGSLGFLSRERVRDEWTKMLAKATPSAGIGLWQRAGVLGAVWPELATLHEEGLASLDDVPRDVVLITAAAMQRCGVSPHEAGGAALRLKFSSREIERIHDILVALAEPLPDAEDAIELRKWIARHRGVAQAAIVVSPLDAEERDDYRQAVAAIESSGAPLAVSELAISGDDLKTIGIAPGRVMGEILRTLLDAVLEDPALNTRDTLLQRARDQAHK